MIIYLLALGPGNRKEDAGHSWSTPLNSFWCCSGSTSESFGKLMDSIYFQRQILPWSFAEYFVYCNVRDKSFTRYPLWKYSVPMAFEKIFKQTCCHILNCLYPVLTSALQPAIARWAQYGSYVANSLKNVVLCAYRAFDLFWWRILHQTMFSPHLQISDNRKEC